MAASGEFATLGPVTGGEVTGWQLLVNVSHGTGVRPVTGGEVTGWQLLVNSQRPAGDLAPTRTVGVGARPPVLAGQDHQSRCSGGLALFDATNSLPARKVLR
jgi:hypothetical protein